VPARIDSSIVVPCFNEAENLPGLVAAFEALRTGDSRDDWELVLVDNGSTDGSAHVFAGLSRPWLRVVTVPPPNVGYGHGLVTGLREAKGNWLAWTHADGQTPPSDVLRGLALLKSSGARTIVKGRRVGRPARDIAFTTGMSVAGALLLGRWFDDVNGQPKCFPRALLDDFDAPPTDLSLDLYLLHLARRRGYRLRTIDVVFGARAHGESKWAFSFRSKAKNVARTLTAMRKMRSRS